MKALPRGYKKVKRKALNVIYSTDLYFNLSIQIMS